jgi:hypothetical protein
VGCLTGEGRNSPLRKLGFTSEAYECTGSTGRKHREEEGSGAMYDVDGCVGCGNAMRQASTFRDRLILPARFHVCGASYRDHLDC